MKTLKSSIFPITMFYKLLFFVFNTFYKDGESTDKPVWMRMYLIMIIASAAFTYNVVVFTFKILSKDISSQSGKTLIFSLATVYAILYYFYLIKNRSYMKIYERLSHRYQGYNVKMYYLLTWAVIVILTYGFLIYIVKGM